MVVALRGRGRTVGRGEALDAVAGRDVADRVISSAIGVRTTARLTVVVAAAGRIRRASGLTLVRPRIARLPRRTIGGRAAADALALCANWPPLSRAVVVRRAAEAP